MMDRVNIIDFLELPEGRQDQIKKRCLSKVRHETLEDVAKQTLETYIRGGMHTEDVALHYKCGHCNGYHLTMSHRGGGKRQMVEDIKSMLDKKLKVVA